MVSYFIPRGRFLIKSANLRQNPKQGKWSMRWTLRSQPMSTSTNKPDTTKIEPIIQSTTTTTTTSLKTPKNVATQNNSGFNDKSKQRRWFSWTGLLKWTPVGICIFGALEWHWHKRKLTRENLPRTASNLQARVYCSMPLRILSRCWGWLADCYVPVTFRPLVYGLWTSVFDVNLEEAADSDLKSYRSLADFFTRSLKDGVRFIDPSNLISPADGKVLHFGPASNSQIEQVKGVTYRIDSFLGPDTWVSSNAKESSYLDNIKHNKNDKTALYQCVIYLAPGDYHRFHSPTQWEPKLRRHFPGELLSVSPTVAQWMPGLFCLNERALYIGNWEHGFFSFTAVGATNVGSVQIYFDEKLKTNQWIGLNVGAVKKNQTFDELELPKGTKLNKGELVGQFNMGSTIVLLFEAPIDFKFTITAGQKIRMGEPLGTIQKGSNK